MTFPLRAGLSALALLTLATALAPARAAAQSASASQPASPNGKIVYQSDQAGDPGVSDIYTMDADGKHETRLTNNAADDSLPIWSPQGNTISFVSNRRGGNEIFLMNADGSNQRPLRSAAPVNSFLAVWSPDGTRLAYPSGGDIYVVEVFAPGGGDSTAVPSNVSYGKAAGTSDLEADWSPDGNRLVVRNDGGGAGNTDLYVLNLGTQQRAQLTNAAGFEAGARWSPMGERIVYEADRSGRGLYVINSDGTGEHLVSADKGSFGAASWSADGTRVAFNSLAGGLYAVGADGSGLTLLSEMSGAKSNVFWSPDGAKVAFTSSNGSSFIDIYVVAADGTGRRETNYTKTRRADEFASSWQKIQ